MNKTIALSIVLAVLVITGCFYYYSTLTSKPYKQNEFIIRSIKENCLTDKSDTVVFVGFNQYPLDNLLTSIRHELSINIQLSSPPLQVIRFQNPTRLRTPWSCFMVRMAQTGHRSGVQIALDNPGKPYSQQRFSYERHDLLLLVPTPKKSRQYLLPEPARNDDQPGSD